MRSLEDVYLKLPIPQFDFLYPILFHYSTQSTKKFREFPRFYLNLIFIYSRTFCHFILSEGKFLFSKRNQRYPQSSKVFTLQHVLQPRLEKEVHRYGHQGWKTNYSFRCNQNIIVGKTGFCSRQNWFFTDHISYRVERDTS